MFSYRPFFSILEVFRVLSGRLHVLVVDPMVQNSGGVRYTKQAFVFCGLIKSTEIKENICAIIG